MVDTGFDLNTLENVSDFEAYKWPVIESGEEYLNHFYSSPNEVASSGLSLFIFSKEKGWGKTTLAHHLVYNTARYWSETSRYDRQRTYRFERSDVFLKNAKKDITNWNASFYILDDLGCEDRSSDWVREKFFSTLQEALHYRRDRKLSTIITSNYNPSDLSNLYDGVVDSLLEIRPDGIIRGNLFRQVEVGGGEDLRLTDPNSNWPI